jgi:tRNA pseudouridine38-40 synthase
LTQEHKRFVLAGRTDAGVHAQGQVANIRTASHLPVNTIKRGLNALVPADLAVLDAWEVAEEFHARFSANRRYYRYLIDTSSVELPFLRQHVVHVPHHLDYDAMNQTLAMLVGEHDFAAFAGAGPPEGSTVRRCFLATCEPVEMFGRTLIAIDLAANAFLRHMVRNIVGTVLLVGRKRMLLEEFANVLKSRNRKQAGPTAPAHGLYLVSVGYPDEPITHD